MINVIIQDVDNFFKRGLIEALHQAFEAKYQRSLTFYEEMTEETIGYMDIIILEVRPGDNVQCYPLLQYRKKRSVIVGFYEGDAPLLQPRAPLCLKNMVYLNKRSPMTKIRNDVLFAWNEHITGNCEWVMPNCKTCSHVMLSRQQQKIAHFTIKGFNNRQIAGLMNINAKTVSAHKHCIMEKFNIDNNAELVQFLRRRIAVRPDDNLEGTC
ncbi:LuxR C-terminal-related transcriptional regulator [Siccibacter colletis]|uniref:Helix-turn-helix transcriptional regulator n=1 Tax=Siccibacter colletis TaxID=1505757 RepID=A0ABY6JAZ0_9ENTR|nr:LuxR C-terminal-related transcriptional regulator [Siccibacter colletis]UYU30973.1 helix-turn-helix transcriptional regulator [Siccibacter colletis]